ncbi:MAG: single-stranded-DNA-specific exonuclease RecJ [Spirochaetaceae bacterium]|jgi:single-stranded-DNA-specific exonuclease|nr:single-stranded-DNA-specific exonuclease RecJ [Spirochaetaceae bacterium]
MIWNKKEIDSSKVREVSSLFNIDLLTASIFVRRGIIEPEQFRFFLEDDFRFLHNPFILSGMEDVVDRIFMAASEGEKVMIFGDRDVDGITSTVIMVQTLRDMGIDTQWAVPMGEDNYGLSIESIDRFYKESGSLILTVDCGISAFDEISYASSLSMDVIVIDHHNPRDQTELPGAFAIINPKKESDPYPFEGLAGCGISSKVIWALCLGRTDLYNQRFTIINMSSHEGSTQFEAVKIENLTPIDTLNIKIQNEVSHKRITEFLLGEALFVFDKDKQLKMLRDEIFGSSVDISLYDLKNDLLQTFPSLAGETLESLAKKSRISKYEGGSNTPTDVLVNLFITYLMKKYETAFLPFMKSLDLVALGTIADLMPLLDENRIIVKKGVDLLNRTERPALQQLLLKLDQRGKKIRTTDISWQITPVINSSGRMGEADIAVNLLLSEDLNEIDLLSDKLIELNKKRRSLGDTAWNIVFSLAPANLEEYNKKLIILMENSIPRGITGILASRLSQTFHVPAIVLTTQNNIVTGSMRSLPGISVNNFLQSLSHLFLDYGGHDLAAGFSLNADKLPQLLKESKMRLTELEKATSEEHSIDIDAELPSKFMNLELEKLIDMFEPYGEKNRSLVFMSKNVKVADVNIIGKTGDHLKLLIDSGDFKWPAVYWNSSVHYKTAFEKNDTVDIVYNLNRNYYQGRETLQLSILDLKK